MQRALEDETAANKVNQPKYTSQTHLATSFEDYITVFVSFRLGIAKYFLKQIRNINIFQTIDEFI